MKTKLNALRLEVKRLKKMGKVAVLLRWVRGQSTRILHSNCLQAAFKSSLHCKTETSSEHCVHVDEIYAKSIWNLISGHRKTLALYPQKQTQAHLSAV